MFKSIFKRPLKESVVPALAPADADAKLNSARGLYLGMMQKCLINTIYEDSSSWPQPDAPFDTMRRRVGGDWPSQAHSMIGQERMFNLRCLCEYAIVHDVPGDFIETGVWRGGASIMMRAVLAAYGVTDRKVWVADSFAGLPPPDAERYPHDAGDILYRAAQLAVSLEEVKRNFDLYDLLDDQVRFLKGWFKDTLHVAPIGPLAVLRLDGDLYESTMDALVALYDKVSPGGFIIIDDFALDMCRAAVEDFRAARNVREPIQEIDGFGVFWERKR